MRNTKTTLSAPLAALCLLASGLAPARLHAQTEAYPNTDERGSHYKDYDGGRLYDDGSTLNTLDDIGNEAGMDAMRSAARYDAIRSTLRSRFGLQMTMDEYKQILGKNIPPCQFTPQPDVERQTLEHLNTGQTPDQQKHMADFEKACLDRVHAIGVKLGLPADDIGLPFAVAVYDACAIYDNVNMPPLPSILYLIGTSHMDIAAKMQQEAAGDEKKQQMYTVFALAGGDLDFLWDAVLGHNQAALNVLKASGEPVPTPAQARQQAYAFLKRCYLPRPESQYLTPAGLFARGGHAWTFHDGGWYGYGVKN